MISNDSKKISVSKDIRNKTNRLTKQTNYFELKNRSKSDVMTNVELIFQETTELNVERRMKLADTLPAQQKVRVKPEVDGMRVKLVKFYVVWTIRISLSSQTQSADPGYYFSSVKAKLEPNDSFESYRFVQKKL